MGKSKKCTKCEETKALTEFNRDKQKSDGLRYRCRDCEKPSKRAYYLSNRDTILEQGKDYYQDNKDKVKAGVKARAPRYLRRRRLADPVFRIRHSLSVQVSAAFRKTQGYTEFSQLYSIIGLCEEGFINHLHETFELNYGMPRSWIDLKDVQIDHIIPLTTAKTEEDVKKLNHYTNLQLLFKEDNQRKGTKVVDRLG